MPTPSDAAPPTPRDPASTEMPEAKAFPKPKKRSDTLEVPNFAGNEKTLKAAIPIIRAYFQKFQNQSARDEFETRMNDADQMMRMAPDQTKDAANLTADIDTRPGAFFKTITMITANQNDILYAKDDIPIKYTPELYLDEADQLIAEQNAWSQNRALEYSFTIDNRREKLKEATGRGNKYANLLCSMEVRTVKSTRKERVPAAYLDDADKSQPHTPTEWKRETVTTEVTYPTFKAYQMEDCWFDAMIDDVNQQQCIIVRSYPTLGDAAILQGQGEYINVENFGKDQYYQSESPSDVRSERQTNAGEDDDTGEATGNLDRYDVWLKAPIDADGKWDPKGTLPEWHWFTIFGNLENNSLVCTRINPNPYDDDEHPTPYYLAHIMPDDKGAFHMGWDSVIAPLYQEMKTTTDQWFYNKNLINAAPWLIEEGAIISSNLDFDPRKPIYMRRGKMDRAKRLEIKSNTGDMLEFLRWLGQQLMERTFTTKPFQGVEMGSRTSASEFSTAFDQGIKVFLELTRYFANPLLTWMAKKDARLFRQFAPPKQQIVIMNNNEVAVIRPGLLYGPVNVKVEAIDDFEDDTIRRLEQDKLLQLSLPVLEPETQRKVIASVYRSRNVLPTEELNEAFGVKQDTDAKNRAESENLAMINDLRPATPKPGENHPVHLRIHKNRRAWYEETEPNADPETFRLFDAHIAATERLMAEEQAAAAPQTGPPGMGGQAQQQPEPTGLPSAEAPVTTPGDVAQNLLGAEMGGMA